MNTSSGPWHGRFVWHDLVTTDAARAQDYYVKLFGWRIEVTPMGGMDYRMIVHGPTPIGGIVEQKQIPASHWMTYVSVPDVDAAAKKCKELSGSVFVPPTDIPNVGRFAVVTDPNGAYFTLFHGNADSPGFDPDLPFPGRVCWNELLASDDAKAQSYYSAMFGWKDEKKDMGPMGTYHVQTLGGKQVGGIMRNPMNGAPDAWLIYFLVEDLPAATKKAASLGGKPCMENVPIPGMGAFSMLIDPVGAVFALYQPAK